MTPSDLILRAVTRIAVPDDVHDSATKLAAAAGFKDPDAARRLYKEWVNDMVVLMDGHTYADARRDPAAAFLAWLGERLEEPYHVTFRANDLIRARFGDEVALLFVKVRWKQEVAWARRMRGSDNDTITAMAETWLRAARRDPLKMFLALAYIYAAEASMDTSYRDAPFHTASEAEILDGAVGGGVWRPLWLRFAEREFGPILYNKPRQMIEAMAVSVRAAELRERMTRQRAAQAERLRSYRPSMMVGVLDAALKKGLSSDDLVLAEERFIERIASGDFDLSPSSGPAWMVFVRSGMQKFAGASPAPTDEERAARIEAIETLTPSWTGRLPPDFASMGCNDRRNLMSWFDAVSANGDRTPPRDPAVDYGMWLVELAPLKSGG